MIKYKLSCRRFDQINDHKHAINLYGQLSTKLLLQAAKKNTKIRFDEDWMITFFIRMVLEATV